MKGTETAMNGGKKLIMVIEKYKFVFLVLLAGVLLLLLPSFGGGTGSMSSSTLQQEGGADFDLDALERKLSATLSQVEGAGQVQVVLTVKAGPRSILAQDVTTSEGEGMVEKSASTVVANKGSSGQEAVLLQEVYPVFQGALVVCPGGDDPTIRLNMVEAMSALTGLGADKISICKGK